jgi:hypothetical protein
LRSIQRYPRNARGTVFSPGGTGNIPAGAKGESPDREIINGPGNGNYLPSAFSALRVSGIMYHPSPGARDLSRPGTAASLMARRS